MRRGANRLASVAEATGLEMVRSVDPISSVGLHTTLRGPCAFWAWLIADYKGQGLPAISSVVFARSRVGELRYREPGPLEDLEGTGNG